ncbi:KEOPS complex subunit Pcc1 [Halalkalicoccus subterraneus]|uniref:KEOPS complex subunit Pcc1 n=1 Tax=Halalkalicoccus subterraneus TaxID=2675002 RepID=UPI000EFD1612|nr:KEOPS complex subunit Pcc1 [Halalkalicoccus subterraneus]
MRRIEIRTTHDDPALVARSIAPDNTPEMETRTVDERVVTTITRDSTGGLRTTADDYVVNLAVADEVAQLSDRQTTPNHE